MNGHYDETALQDYLDDPDAFAGRAELEAHVEHCVECRTVLEELRALESALALEPVWEPSIEDIDAPPALRALADLLDAEDAEAEELLAPLLGSPASFRRANVAATQKLRTVGVARRLCAESRRLRERQPMHALAVADAAIAIGDQLTAERYPETLVDELRGDAWLERANALRYLGRHAEAFDALDIATRAYARSPVAVFSNAVVDYTRAVVALETGQLADALRGARRSARIFRQFGEDGRYVNAKSVEAAVLFDQSRYREARELFESLLPIAKQLGEAATLAGLYGNIANCELRLQHLESAGVYFERALSLYEALGLETERIRARWNIGCLRIARGELADGLGQLREAKREFERIGARSDAALVTLDIAEALLATGDRLAAEEAARLCAALVEGFAAFGATDNALTALAFLREAFESGSATPILVRRVRDYLEMRPEERSTPFIPPSPT